MGEFSLAHLLVIAFIFILLFGSTRIEGLGKSLGRAIKGFKQGINEIDADAKEVHTDLKKTAADLNRPPEVTRVAASRSSPDGINLSSNSGKVATSSENPKTSASSSPAYEPRRDLDT